MSNNERLGADPSAVPTQLEDGTVTLPKSVEEKFIIAKQLYADEVRKAYDDIIAALEGDYIPELKISYALNALAVLLKGNMPVEIEDISDMEVNADGEDEQEES